LPINSKYLDRLFDDAIVNSSAVNIIFEFLPATQQDRFIDRNPFSGFGQFIATRRVSSSENDRTLSTLSQISPSSSSEYKLKFAAFQSALGILLEDEHSINEELGNRKLPAYIQQQSDHRTANLIEALGGYFAEHDYGGVHYQQLIVIAECIAFLKRFYRCRWHIETEDVLEAWFFVNFFKRPSPPLSQSSKIILRYISAQNSAGKFPTQRQIIRRTGLGNKVVSYAVGLRIKRPGGSGKLILQGYVEYNFDQEGYKLTQLGELALTNDFHITVDGTTFQPKSTLEE
jgi:hypothetical protein